MRGSSSERGQREAPFPASRPGPATPPVHPFAPGAPMVARRSPAGQWHRELAEAVSAPALRVGGHRGPASPESRRGSSEGRGPGRTARRRSGVRRTASRRTVRGDRESRVRDPATTGPGHAASDDAAAGRQAGRGRHKGLRGTRHGFTDLPGCSQRLRGIGGSTTTTPPARARSAKGARTTGTAKQCPPAPSAPQLKRAVGQQVLHHHDRCTVGARHGDPRPDRSHGSAPDTSHTPDRGACRALGCWPVSIPRPAPGPQRLTSSGADTFAR